MKHTGHHNADSPETPALNAAPSTVPLIEFRNISKKYGATYANRNIRLEIAKGEVHALAGENGAGKTTLMNMLFGRVRPDSGSILFQGKPVRFRSSRDAIRAGIGMVHQNILLFPQLSVLENIVLGNEPSRNGILTTGAARKELLHLQNVFGFKLGLDLQAKELPFAQRQQIELLGILYRKAEILILDEPTSLLAPFEIERLLEFLRELRTRGRTIFFISHRLGEVFSIADRITVLRQGCVAATLDAAKTSPEEVARLMVSGAERTDETLSALSNATEYETALQVNGLDKGKKARHRSSCSSETPILELHNLNVSGSESEPALVNLSISVRKSEILGIGGIVGNGQGLFVGALAGKIGTESGTILFGGSDITHLPLKDRLRDGIRRLPEDPAEEALLPDRPLWENFLLGRQWKGKFQKTGILLRRRILEFAREQIEMNNIAASSPFDPISSLSGGNRQKAAIAGVLADSPRLVILEQPSRGLDLHASFRLKQKIFDLSDRSGTTFILLSYDLDELISLCDRIAVFFRGKIMGITERENSSRELLSKWMVGMEADNPPTGVED